MSGITIEQAYEKMQAECGIEAGDMVKQLRGARDGEMGWDHSGMGDTYTTSGIFFVICMQSGVEGVMLNKDKYSEHGNFYPFFCLELVEKAKPELPLIEVGGHRVAFLDDRIRVCDISVSHETLREILKRVEEKN